MFVQAFDALKIQEHRFGTVEPEILRKSWFAWAFRERFFSCYAIFTWIWTYKTHDLTEYQLNIGSFLQATTFMWSDWQIPGWPQFFQKRLFPSAPSLVHFKCAIIFQSFHLDFLCANLAAPIISYHLFSNFRFARHMIHPGNCSPVPSSVGFNSPIIFLKASFSSSRVRVRPPRSLRTICFRKFSRDAYDPTSKTPLAPSLPGSITRFFLKAPFSSHVVSNAHSHRSERRRRTHCQRWNSPWRLCPDCLRGAPSGLAAAGTRLLGRISSSLQPSEALRSIWGLLLVNLGPVKALCLGLYNGNKILFRMLDKLYWIPLASYYCC